MMDNLISSILHNLPQQTPSSGQPELTLQDILPEMQTGLKPGQMLQLNIDMSSQTIELLTGEGKSQTLPLNAVLNNKLNIPSSENVTMTAKVVSLNGNSVSIRPLPTSTDNLGVSFQTKAEALIRPSEIVVKDVGKTPLQAEIKNVDVLKIIEPYLAKNISPVQRENLKQELSGLQIRGQLLPAAFRETTVENPVKVLQDIFSTVFKGLSYDNKTEVSQMAETIKNALPELVGKTFPAAFADKENVSVLSSLLGDILPQQDVKIPPELKFNFLVSEIIKPAVPENAATRRDVLPVLQNIMKPIEKLALVQPELALELQNKIPAVGDKMLPNMAAFMQAAIKQDVSLWLGKEMTEMVKHLPDGKGKEILAELQQSLQAAVKETPLWKIVEIPLYAESRIDKIRIAVKQYGEEDKDSRTEAPKTQGGTRFVVDTDFSILGRFQFDGFSFNNDRRFDLIVRTEKNIGDDICANIMRIFKTTLHNVDYVGNIGINIKENFIKIGEDENKTQRLPQDLFI